MTGESDSWFYYPISMYDVFICIGAGLVSANLANGAVLSTIGDDGSGEVGTSWYRARIRSHGIDETVWRGYVYGSLIILGY